MSHHDEHTLNDHLGPILQGMRRRWQVQAENLRTIRGGNEQLDILITEPGAAPSSSSTNPCPPRT